MNGDGLGLDIGFRFLRGAQRRHGHAARKRIDDLKQSVFLIHDLGVGKPFGIRQKSRGSILVVRTQTADLRTGRALPKNGTIVLGLDENAQSQIGVVAQKRYF